MTVQASVLKIGAFFVLTGSRVAIGRSEESKSKDNLIDVLVW